MLHWDRCRSQPRGEVSTTIVDRHGKLMRAYAMTDGRWRLPVNATSDVDPSYLKLLFAYEDRRFNSHAGVDPLALGRAVFQLVTRGHVVSGGSTITMQLARLMEPRRQRSISAKLRQIVRAIEIERQMSKQQILDLYLAMAPFGGNLEGIRAASIAYFGKEPKRLSLSEAALLVALPQSPENRRLDRHPNAARAARDRVLDRMVEDGVVSDADAALAKAVPVPRLRKPMPILAPHSADNAMLSVKNKPVIALTLDAGLQQALEKLARDRAVALGPNISVAILAVDNASGDVLARVGSPDYFDDRRAGQVDMTRAVRSPGSTLKPFIYGLAFEDGFVHPESLIDDRPIRFGSYAPENFDMTFQGTVPVRKALQMSLNVPAIALLDRVGASRLSSRLKQAGANLELPKDEAPGLAMGLGGVGITLQDLVQLYSGLARLGNTGRCGKSRAGATRRGNRSDCWIRSRHGRSAMFCWERRRRKTACTTGSPSRPARATATATPGRLVSTAGSPSASGSVVPMARRRRALSAALRAAPILFDAFARTGKLPAALPKPPKGTLMASNAKLPLPLRRYRPLGELVRTDGERAPHIQFPLDGSRIDVSGGDGASSARHAGESGRWGASDHHARQRRVGWGTR